MSFDIKGNKLISFDPNVNQLYLKDNGSITYHPISNLKVIDSLQGIQCLDDRGVVQFILLPRTRSIMDTNKKN